MAAVCAGFVVVVVVDMARLRFLGKVKEKVCIVSDEDEVRLLDRFKGIDLYAAKK